MSNVRWIDRPSLRKPVLVAAYEGWNDAGDAASDAVRWFIDRLDAERIGSIEAEEFFDFTSYRPVVSTDEDGGRSLLWPDTEIWAARTEGDRDLVFLIGPEPHLRWRTYCAAVEEVADAVDSDMVLTVGALLSDVPHTFPTPVSATSSDPAIRAAHGMDVSTYSGPTGMIGVLHSAFSATERPSASVWATVPDYVSAVPSPKATLALVERCLALLGLGLPTTDLQIASASYERQLDELTSEDEDTAAYVARLEEAMRDIEEDDGPNALEDTDPQELVEEVERFLRGDGHPPR